MRELNPDSRKVAVAQTPVRVMRRSIANWIEPRA
jgi:hypothetical protein